MVAEAKLRGQPGVIEGAGQVIASFAEVGPAVVVGRDDHGGSQDRGGGCRLDTVQAQRAVPELARDAGGAGVQATASMAGVRRAISATVRMEALSPLT